MSQIEHIPEDSDVPHLHSAELLTKPDLLYLLRHTHQYPNRSPAERMEPGLGHQQLSAICLPTIPLKMCISQDFRGCVEADRWIVPPMVSQILQAMADDL